MQKEVAEKIGVTKASIFNWEANTKAPDLRHMPAIIEFLGYNPLSGAHTVAEKLVRRRTALGMSQREAAERIGVDQGTLAKWERGEREPWGGFLARVDAFVATEPAIVRTDVGMA